MASTELQELIERAERLPVAEQLLLIARLAETVSHAVPVASARYAWSDIHGAAPYPLLGEDAQAWITRERQEADEHRARLLDAGREDR